MSVAAIEERIDRLTETFILELGSLIDKLASDVARSAVENLQQETAAPPESAPRVPRAAEQASEAPARQRATERPRKVRRSARSKTSGRKTSWVKEALSSEPSAEPEAKPTPVELSPEAKERAAKVLNWVRRNPGSKLGDVSTGTELDPRLARLALVSLREAGSVSMRGARATARYYPEGVVIRRRA